MTQKRKVGPGGGDFALNPNRFGGGTTGASAGRAGATLVKARPPSTMKTTKRPIAEVKFKKTGTGREDGELKAKAGSKTITINKHFDHNIKHTGEWKLHVDGEWHNTYPSLRSAKAAATGMVNK